MTGIFKDFTHLYELQKTLRFELIPVGRTKELLEKNHVFEKDEKIAENYKDVKKYFDRLHKEFIKDAFSHTNLPENLLEGYEQKYFSHKLNPSRASRIDLEKIAKRFKTILLESFNTEADQWKNRYLKNIEQTLKNKNEKQQKKELEKKLKKIKEGTKGIELFFKVEVFDFLKYKYPEAQINGKSIFDPFNKFGCYFKKFHETRINFYKDDGTSTAIPTRIINDNLSIFLENKKIFESKYSKKHKSVFAKNELRIFVLFYFNNCFSQKQIDGYNNTIALINSNVNQLRQNNPEVSKKDLPFFKRLFKQILSQPSKQEIEQDSFIEIFQDEDVFPTMQKFINENKICIPKAKSIFKKFISSQKVKSDEYNISQIYVAKRFINTISNKWFSNWNTIRNLLIPKDKKNIPDFISVTSLKAALQKTQNIVEVNDLFRKEYRDILEEGSDFYQIFLKIWEKEFEKATDIYLNETKEIEKMITEDKKYLPNKKGRLKSGKKGSIQKEKFLDYTQSVFDIYLMMKYFSLEKGKERVWNPEALDEDAIGGFYEKFKEYYENINTWKYFNVFRNYLTKKPYNSEKIKLNFECSSLLSGWSKNYDSYGALIFEKNEKYYLGIINGTKFTKDEIEQLYLDIRNNNISLRLVYNYQKPDFKNFPKLFIRSSGSNFAPAVKKYNLPIDSVLNIYDKGLYKTSNKSSQNYHESLKKIIDYFKLGINQHESYKGFSFKWQETSEYDNISDFYKDVTRSCYKVTWENINFSKLYELIESGRLYLFQIYNKDFELDENIAPKGYNFKDKNGRRNLHSIYWKALFSNTNFKKTILKLNGGAELFYRKLTKNLTKDPIITVKNQIKIIKKNNNIFHKKRFTQNKIYFHCPVSINFTENDWKINTKICNTIRNNSKVKIIGIDRGEKNLAYYSVIDHQGNILETDSFNEVQEREDREPTDYQKKLDQIQKERDWQRKSWQEISSIKEMKKGYISQVVHQICKLIRKYEAIVVFEDLNIGFKRGRFAIEKQIYQNLELALAKKLNYMVFKDAKEEETGHFLQAYQLTPPVINFQDIGKQCGIIFYVPASYTSAICPACGFRKNISTFVEKIEKNIDLINKFNIVYDPDKDRFCFRYKRSDFIKSEKEKEDDSKVKLYSNTKLPDDFTFYSNVERFKYIRDQNNRGGKVEPKYPNDSLKKLFHENGINFQNFSNISQLIKTRNFENENFYKPFIYIISLILQLRNTTIEINQNENNEKYRDFISCPHCYFHSENNLITLTKRYKGKKPFEFNGDANGAYNIARKGILILQKINKAKRLEEIEYGGLTVTQQEYDKYLALVSSKKA